MIPNSKKSEVDGGFYNGLIGQHQKIKDLALDHNEQQRLKSKFKVPKSTWEFIAPWLIIAAMLASMLPSSEELAKAKPVIRNTDSFATTQAGHSFPMAVYLSIASTIYAISLKVFFFVWYDFDKSIIVTILDVFSVSWCVVGAAFVDVIFPTTRAYTIGHTSLSAAISYIFALMSLMLVRLLHSRQVIGEKFKYVELSGRVYIITGSNTGLGYETAKEIVRMGGVVVMACRTLDKANTARNALIKETKCAPSQLIVLHLDLNSFTSVKSFVAEFEKLNVPLHCLVNNAGLMMSSRSVTQDGLEMVFTANHLSAFLLTNLLIPFLQAGTEKYGIFSRVVNVSSSLHNIPKKFNFDDVMAEKNYELFSTYGQSKLANILFTKELQRLLTDSQMMITANCLHPGFVRTEVTRNMNWFLYWGDQLATPFMMMLQKTPSQGAFCSVHVATSVQLEGQGGAYYSNCQVGQCSLGAQSSEDAERLWALSEQLTDSKCKWRKGK